MSTINPFEPPKASLEDPAAGDVAPALWNPDAAGAWSLLLTPIFGSVLLRRNWRAIGDEGKARAGTIWIVVSVLMLIPSFLFGSAGAVVYIVVWYFAWQKPQSKYIRERWGKDYPRQGWMMPIVSAIGIYLALVAVIMAIGIALVPSVK